MNKWERLLESYKRAIERQHRMVTIDNIPLSFPKAREGENDLEMMRGWIKINKIVSDLALKEPKFSKMLDEMFEDMEELKLEKMEQVKLGG